MKSPRFAVTLFAVATIVTVTSGDATAERFNVARGRASGTCAAQGAQQCGLPREA